MPAKTAVKKQAPAATTCQEVSLRSISIFNTKDRTPLAVKGA
jgi:hypothetical protein